jgi:hypothetical protein
MDSRHLIREENNKSLGRIALFLTFSGFILIGLGYSGANNATIFFGAGFSLISIIAYIFIVKARELFAKIIWGICTPTLLIISPYFFSLSQPTTIYSYSYFFIAGMFVSAYSFKSKGEGYLLLITISLYFIGIIFYDRIIIWKSFEGNSFANTINSNYFNFKSSQILHFVSMVYLVTVIRRNRQLIEDKLQEQIRKLQNFTSSLISTSKNKLISSGNLKEALEEILRSTAQVVDVSRISVWEFDETDFSIRLVVGYNSLDNSYFYDGYLRSESYPVYFQSLLSEKIINANDAVNDPKTKEFTESYLIPLGIKSMMDSPFFIDGKFKGILCFEEQRAIKQWDNMDQLFSISISKLISIAYYCQIRLEQYVSLLETRESLELKNELLESINSKMNIINGDLASDLHYKEEEAKQLQQFINEVSFKNAHHVRGPLSRILGLISLYKSEIDPESKKIYMDFLDQSAKELDDMVKEINAVLHRNFSK